ncbi:hypothetical protein YC2023_118773 [Brassica napus]
MQLEKFRLCEKIKSGSRLVLQPLSETSLRMCIITNTIPSILSGVVTLSFTDSPRLFFDSDFSVTEKYLSRFGENGDTTPAIKSSSAAINSFHSPESAPNEEAAITTPQCFQDIVGRLCNFKSSSRILISS